MTSTNGNGSITVVSNPADDPTLLLHFALFRVSAGEVRFHSGFYGPQQGFTGSFGGLLLPEEQDALYEAANARLIAICVPRVKDGDPALAERVQWLRPITLDGPPVTGSPVRITGVGWVRLSAMNAAAPVRAA